MDVRLVTATTVVLMTAVLLGLFLRERWRLSIFLVAYLLAGLVEIVLTSCWPERFWGQRSYMACQGLEDLLKLGIALEVAWRTFRFFSGARDVASGLAGAILALTAATALLAPVAAPNPDPYVIALTIVTPRVQCGVLWVMVATLAVALWFRVPIHPFHIVLLTSFVICLAFYLGLMTILASGFNQLREYVAVLGQVVWQLAAAAWAYAAWRPDGAPVEEHVAVLKRLYRWRPVAARPAARATT
jgi:hypothetical protein